MSAPCHLIEKSGVAGFHEFLCATVILRRAPAAARALDLGAGSGALALRLQAAGIDILAVDGDALEFRASVPFRQLDLNAADFASQIGRESFDLVTAVEVIEHVESPIGFLRNVAHLLKPGGWAVITTPNVDNVPARLKFLLTGQIRCMDAAGEPTHISPIFWDLFLRQYLPAAGLELAIYYHYPPAGWAHTRASYAWFCSLLARFVRGGARFGERHVFVLQRVRAPSGA